MSSEDTEIRKNRVVLEVDNISLRFGGTRALVDVSLNQKDGEILAIIGPNGAGKTSLINCISGFYRPNRGHVFFDGKEVTHLAPHKIARLGLARTFQNLRLFTNSTVLENLMTGAYIHFKSSFLADCVYFGRSRREDVKRQAIIEELISFLGLGDVRKSLVGSMPYGIRKRVELGRALALEPRLLMLDEPMAGMNVEEKKQMCRIIFDILKVWNLPIILIEHDMGVVMEIASQLVVLDFGSKIAEGTPDEIKANPDVIHAYLGEETDE